MKRALLVVAVGPAVGLLIGIYIAYLYVFSEAGLISVSERFQFGLSLANLIVVAILVAATFWYADSTKRIADATRTQADATRVQAEVVAKQLSQGVRPIIRFAFDSLPHLDGCNLVVRNIGLGPALNVKCWVHTQQPDGSPTSFNGDRRGRQFRTSTLEMNGVMGDGTAANWQLHALPRPSENRPCTFFAIYQDIYGNAFVSKATYDPIDFEGARPLWLTGFSTNGLTEEETRGLLVSGGYADN